LLLYEGLLLISSAFKAAEYVDAVRLPPGFVVDWKAVVVAGDAICSGRDVWKIDRSIEGENRRERDRDKGQKSRK
jgi:hypothetical protein